MTRTTPAVKPVAGTASLHVRINRVTYSARLFQARGSALPYIRLTRADRSQVTITYDSHHIQDCDCPASRAFPYRQCGHVAALVALGLLPTAGDDETPLED